jgi:hypothetical protein
MSTDPALKACTCKDPGYWFCDLHLRITESEIQATAYHNRMVEQNAHVEHGIKSHLVESGPKVVIMVSCPCGLAYTTTDGWYSSGHKGLYTTMTGRDADE